MTSTQIEAITGLVIAVGGVIGAITALIHSIRTRAIVKTLAGKK